jgi:hypothetical protein
MRNSRQLRMVQRLRAAVARRKARRDQTERLVASLPKNSDGSFPPPRTEAEAGDQIRVRIVQAGLPPVDSLDDLTREQLHHYCAFHNIDPPRDFMELPCWSWELPEGAMMECYHLLGKRNRGEITPQEHRRRVREACGLPPEEPSPSGQAAGAVASSGGG